MGRPSRGFVIAAAAVILVAAAFFGHWLRLREPNRWAAAPPPDAWEREAAPGDLRSSPDGPPMADWVCVGTGQFAIGGRDNRPFVCLVPKGEEQPSGFRRFMDRVSGDPMRSWKERRTRNLYRAEDPVVTPSGKWWRYSSRWWKGANPPAAPGK